MDINEIARLAGVSRATVSRYLNDGYVSQEKRDLIARVIQTTGYVPSRQAQQLRTGKTGMVGVIIPTLNSQSVSRMVAGITEVMHENHYQILLANANMDSQVEVDYLRIFAEKNQVDGIILLATVLTDEHQEAFASINVPIVILGQHVEDHTCVYHDDYHAMFDVAKVALQQSRVPAYIGVNELDEAAGHMRHKGFLDACAAAGITPPPHAQQFGDFTMDSGYFCCEQILDTAPQVDTIVCATDTLAMGAMACLREYGKSIPQDVQVTGLGDSEFSRAVTPALTTAHLYYKNSGADAGLLLVTAMGKLGNMSGARELKMGYEVYVRTSTR